MIRVFSPTDTDFSSNGDVVLRPYKAKVHKEDNGDYYLELEAGIEYVDYLTANRIIVADTPQGAQALRISNPSKTKSKISLKAWHVYYDSKNYVIADSNVVEKNGNDAINHLNNATDSKSPFTVSSDIANIDSFRCVRKSLYEAFSTVLERWGGHLVRDNFNVKIMANTGQDNGVTVRYKKNLKEITSEANWDNVCTKILPVGSNGLLLDELYLRASTQYDIPYTKVVSFTQEINEEGYGNKDLYHQALIDDLRKQATKYLAENCVPKVSYTLKANLEKITDIGDKIEVIDERLGINVVTHVTAFDYDCIQKRYTEFEFGNYNEKLSNLMHNISSNTDKKIEKNNGIIRVELNEKIKEGTEAIWKTLGSSYVVYDGDKILVLDQLPKDSAKNVIMINSRGISFSNTGINGTFSNVWTIDNTFNMARVKVVNLTADLIRGGTLKLGSNLNEYGRIEIYDQANQLIAELNNQGLKLHSESGLEINGKTIFDMVYPVGAIYISINEASPSVLFGGTWEQIQGGILIGTGNSSQTAYVWKRVS